MFMNMHGRLFVGHVDGAYMDASATFTVVYGSVQAAGPRAGANWAPPPLLTAETPNWRFAIQLNLTPTTTTITNPLALLPATLLYNDTGPKVL